MDAPGESLDAVRREIDAIDDQIHDALMRRSALVERVRAAKNGGPAMRPGREAKILRRILARHQGALPPAVIARIWREIISAVTQQQSPMRIALFARERSASFWDLARSHYGSVSPVSLHRNMHAVIRAASADDGTIGILPLPAEGEREPWWSALASGGDDRPHVIARLPFLARPEGTSEPVEGLVISRVPPEESGIDRTLIAVSLKVETSRGRLTDLFAAAGLTAQTLAVHRPEEGREAEDRLLEIDGFVSADDPRLQRIKAEGEDLIERLVVLGAYAVPIGE